MSDYVLTEEHIQAALEILDTPRRVVIKYVGIPCIEEVLASTDISPERIPATIKQPTPDEIISLYTTARDRENGAKGIAFLHVEWNTTIFDIIMTPQGFEGVYTANSKHPIERLQEIFEDTPVSVNLKSQMTLYH